MASRSEWMKIYYQANREQRLAYARTYYENNVAKRKDYIKAYRQENRARWVAGHYGRSKPYQGP